MNRVSGLVVAAAVLGGGSLPAAAQYVYDYRAAQASTQQGSAFEQGRTPAPAAAYQPAPDALPPSAPPRPAPRIFDEFKIGAQDHDISFGEKGLERGDQVNGEILFVSPDFLRILYAPRPHIGVSSSTAGATSYGYAGLTWGVTLFDHILDPFDSVFINASLGGAVHDGYIDHQPPSDDPAHKKLGSRILFRESVEAGYGITQHVNVSVFIDHISNANLGTHNAGITNLGGRIGYKF